MKKIHELIGFSLVVSICLSSCAVGPNYKKQVVTVPINFKETPRGWKVAQPRDNFDRGKWWTIFHDRQLNSLEERLNICNQTIAASYAQYIQARALVDEARAGFFPMLTAALSVTRQKSGSARSGGAATTTTSSSSTSSSDTPDASSTTSTSQFSAGSTPFTSNSLVLNASWEPDLWGSVRRAVEASKANAQASAAQLALARLSAQASLAQYYFELRGLDIDQDLLNRTVKDYRKMLRIVRNQYNSGTVSRADVVQAQSQLQNAQAQAINLSVNRSKYEHAIAVLIGEPASSFGIPPYAKRTTPPPIPVVIPAELLERRPDIANAERLVAQANAQIGVAVAAYFPTVTLSATGTMSGIGSIGSWLSNPVLGWSLGPQIAETILDGGLRSATIAAARANYYSTVATYRQTVLAAFQDVEDNLSSLGILRDQSKIEKRAVESARLALKLVTNQYRAGTVPFSSVITAQNTLLTAEKNDQDVMYLRMTSAVGLIKALGGGWHGCRIDSTEKYV